jgi:hypothetical protein
MRRRVRLGDLRKLLRAQYGATLPDDDAGRECLYELLLPISLGPHADIQMPNAADVWAPWMQHQEAQQLIDQIKRMPRRQRMPNARQLGERMGLINGLRDRLKLRTIAASDLTPEQALQLRRAKQRARMRRVRQARDSKSRAEYEAASLSRTKPWEREGISRRTWYRRRGTSPCAMNLSDTEHTLVPPEKSRTPRRGLANGHAVTLKPNTPTKLEKPRTRRGNAPDGATVHELSAHTCATVDVTAHELGAHTGDTATALSAYTRLAMIVSESYEHAAIVALKAGKVLRK